METLHIPSIIKVIEHMFAGLFKLFARHAT